MRYFFLFTAVYNFTLILDQIQCSHSLYYIGQRRGSYCGRRSSETSGRRISCPSDFLLTFHITLEIILF